MDIREIEQLKKRVEKINSAISEKKAQIKVLKEQFQKKMNELEELGITGLKGAKEDFLKTIEEHIAESDTECSTLADKIEKAVSHAEEQLNSSEDEIF